MTHIENEVEAPRDDAFGLAALNAEKRRERLERAYRMAYKIGVWCVALVAAVMFGYHVRAPADQPFFIERPSGVLSWAERVPPGQIQCVQDWTEGDCYRCAAKSSRGEKIQTHAC